jgi:hypothetical protein
VRRCAAPHTFGLARLDGEAKAIVTHRAYPADGNGPGSGVVILGKPAGLLGMTGTQGKLGPVTIGGHFGDIRHVLGIGTPADHLEAPTGPKTRRMTGQ